MPSMSAAGPWDSLSLGQDVHCPELQTFANMTLTVGLRDASGYELARHVIKCAK